MSGLRLQSAGIRAARWIVWSLAIVLLFALGVSAADTDALNSAQLRYAVVVTRHGVRSPTWPAERLNQYSSDPWPDWKVPPGNLTAHGSAQMKLLGAYYREWLVSEHLLQPTGCSDAKHVRVHADNEQCTVESGRAFYEGLLPGCSVKVDSIPAGSPDPVFDPVAAGIGKPDPLLEYDSVCQRALIRVGQFQILYGKAFAALQEVLMVQGKPPQKPLETPKENAPVMRPEGVKIDEAISVASTLSEDLLLEYAEGMQGNDLGWGRLDRTTLRRALETHILYGDLTQRGRYGAKTRGSNLLNQVRLALEQAKSGQVIPGAMAPPGPGALIFVGHDTNQLNLSGMLGIVWGLPGFQPIDTPPGGALIFSLWQGSDGGYFVRTQYLAQTLEQMRNGTPLSLASPPAVQDVSVKGCPVADQTSACPWDMFSKALTEAIDPQFVAK